MLPKEIQDLLNVIPEDYRIVVRPILLLYEAKIEKLEGRIKELEDQLSKNSGNSSKPPSSDEFSKPSPRSLRKKTGRKVGGQKGHKGNTLSMVGNPDQTKAQRVFCCEHCQKDISAQPILSIEKRQVYDLPELKMMVTEYQSEVKACSCGHINKGGFPVGVNHYVQYGARVKGLLAYLQDYQLLPYDRTQELVKDLFGHQISTGTLYNIRQYAYGQLSDFEDQLKALLRHTPVAGFDETGLRVMTKRLWLHSCSTNDHAYYEVHTKRGQEAMDHIGILPHFKGIAIHDFWKSYYHYACEHGLCNAHILRELIFIKERFDQPWAEQLIELLLKMKAAKQ